jgi:hypothetical protein
VRGNSQSAAQGLILAALAAIKTKNPTFKIGLIITNELKDNIVSLQQYDLEVIYNTIDFWLKRGGSKLKASELLSSLSVYPNISKHPHLYQRYFNLLSVGDDNGVYVFCNSYPSNHFRDYLRLLGRRCSYLEMAPTDPGSIKNYNKALLIRDECILKHSLKEPTTRFIRGGLPYYFGNELKPSDGEPLSRNILISGENVLYSRILDEDVIHVLAPILRNPLLKIFLIGASLPQFEEFWKKRLHPLTGIRQGDIRAKLSFTPYVPDLFHWMADNIGLYYSGTTSGGGTTMAGAVNLGIPVVGWSGSDGGMLWMGDTAYNTSIEAYSIIERITSDDNFRAEFLLSQRKALNIYNADSIKGLENFLIY